MPRLATVGGGKNGPIPSHGSAVCHGATCYPVQIHTGETHACAPTLAGGQDRPSALVPMPALTPIPRGQHRSREAADGASETPTPAAGSHGVAHRRGWTGYPRKLEVGARGRTVPIIPGATAISGFDDQPR